jgi:exodeoxyribonuclease-3
MARQMFLQGLIDTSSAPAEKPSSQIRILNWNIRNPSLKRAELQANWIIENGANIVILTEAKNSEGGAHINSLLEGAGFDVLPLPPANKDYCVIVATRGFPSRVWDLDATFLTHRIGSVVCETSLGDMKIVGLYVPSRGPMERRNIDKRIFQEQITKLLCSLTSSGQISNLIIGGDLNVLEREHIPQYSVFGEWEYSFYDSFIESGLTDAFRLLHPQEHEYSWFGRLGDGYRFDHLFITRNLSPYVKQCTYLHAPRIDNLSDHSAMYLELCGNS